MNVPQTVTVTMNCSRGVTIGTGISPEFEEIFLAPSDDRVEREGQVIVRVGNRRSAQRTLKYVVY